MFSTIIEFILAKERFDDTLIQNFLYLSKYGFPNP